MKRRSRRKETEEIRNYYTISEAARMVGTNPQTLNKWIFDKWMKYEICDGFDAGYICSIPGFKTGICQYGLWELQKVNSFRSGK